MTLLTVMPSTVNDAGASSDICFAADTPAAGRDWVLELVIIDSSVADYQTLALGLLDGCALVVVDENRDGIEQISEVLQHYPALKHLHLVGHGSPGCLYLGNICLSLETLEAYAPKLQTWFSNPASTLMLYGCHVAYGRVGSQFLTKLHELIGVGIAASTQGIGRGNWDLNRQVGMMGTWPVVPFHAERLRGYQSTLGIVLLGSYDTPGSAYDIEIVGTTAYVGDWESGLQILDVSNPTSPALIGSYDTLRTVFGIAVVGTTAYVTDSTSGLQILDVSNPTSPSLIGSFNTQDSALDVVVVGTTAYVLDTLAFVLDGMSSLRIIDITNPTSPTLIGSFDIPGLAAEVAVTGTIAYLTNGLTFEGLLRIIDISNPSTPTLISTYDTPSEVWGVHIVDSTAYLSDGENGLQILDVSNPASPTLVGSYDLPGYSGELTVVGTTAYVIDNLNGLQILDVSNPVSPILIDSYDIPGGAMGVTVVGSTIYVAAYENGVQILTFNELPTSANTTVYVDEGINLTFNAAAIPFSDIDIGDTLEKIQITALESVGDLFLDTNNNGIEDEGEAIILNQEIATANLGMLTFKPIPHSNGVPYTTIGFKVSDGKEYSDETYTLAINVTAGRDISNPEFPMEGKLGTALPPIQVTGRKQTVQRQGTNETDTLEGNPKNDIMTGLDGNDRLISGLSLLGFGRDHLFGGNGNDRLFSGKGNDLLDGGNGRDRLESGQGSDILLGEEGNDRLNSGVGNDVLTGGLGVDSLSGGAGRDTFVFTTVDEGTDVITDFNGTDDLIDLRPIFAQAAFSGSTPWSRFTQFVQLEQVGSDTAVKIDADGNGTGTTFVTLATLKNVSLSAVSGLNFVIT